MLDQTKGEKEDAIQKVRNLSEQEVLHLKNSILSLRQETERLKLEHLDAAQKAISSNANEMNHYKNMISSLRDEIDQKKNTSRRG